MASTVIQSMSEGGRTNAHWELVETSDYIAIPYNSWTDLILNNLEPKAKYLIVINGYYYYTNKYMNGGYSYININNTGSIRLDTNDMIQYPPFVEPTATINEHYVSGKLIYCVIYPEDEIKIKVNANSGFSPNYYKYYLYKLTT